MIFDPYDPLMIVRGSRIWFCFIYTASVSINILIENIIPPFCMFYPVDMYILFMTGLPLWDTVSIKLAQ